MNNLFQVIYQEACHLYKKKKYEQAEVVLIKLFQNNPKEVCIHYMLAVVMIRLKRDRKRIFGHLKNILHLQGSSSFVNRSRLLLGYLSIEENEFNLAKDYLNPLKDHVSKKKNPYSFLAYIAYKENEYKQAKTYYEKSLQIDTDNPNTLNALGYLYLEMGQENKAEEYLLKALKKNESHYAYLDSVGWFYFLKKQFSKAIHYLTKSFETKPLEITKKHLEIAKKASFK